MSSVISPSSRGSDDLLDFVLAHHTREERGSRCFSLMGRHVCCRCLGWVSSAMVAGGLALAGAFAYPWWAYLLPVPAFMDWGGRKLGFFEGSRLSALGTGAILGVSVPYFYMDAFALDWRAFAIAAGYIAIYGLLLVLGKGNPRAQRNDRKPETGN